MHDKVSGHYAEGQEAACQVSRIGVVVSAADAAGLWIRVQGRDIRIASDRVDGSLRPGDAVRWSGRKWVAATGGGSAGGEAAP